jgi:hypothetical protein
VGFYAGILCDPRQRLFADATIFVLEAGDAQLSSLIIAVPMSVAAVIEIAIQTSSDAERLDLRFFARWSAVVEWFHHPGSRMILIPGFLVLAAWIGGTEFSLYRNSLSSGSLLFPNRGFNVILATWSLLWIAGSLCRPRCTTFTAALMLGMIALLRINSGFWIVRE